MNTKHPFLPFVFLFVFTLISPLLAEEHEIPYPTRPEAIAFLKERIPLAITLMDRVRKEEGEREYQEVLLEAVEHVFEYREFLHHDGKEVADLHIRNVQIELEIAQLIHRFHDEAKTPEERQAIRTALKTTVRQQLAQEKKIKELELKEALEFVNELKQDIANLNTIAEEDLNREVQELLHGDEDEDEESEESEESEEDDD